MVWIVLLVVIAGLWVAWLALARISVYAVTDQARLEVQRAVHSVDAPVGGRVVAVHADLAAQVETGDVLFDLDARPQKLDLERVRAEKAALARELAALRRAIEAEARALADTRRAGHEALREAQARTKQAEAAATLAKREAEQTTELGAEGHVSQIEQERSASEAEQQRAAVDARRSALGRLRADSRSEQSDRHARLEQLEREAVQLEGEIAKADATITRLLEEIDRRRVRAPVAGEIGELGEPRVGSVVELGERLASVVPDGELKVVADFLPPDALGRVQPGQPAHVRMHGFPWTQYGTVAARVERVSSETRDGLVRVHLEVIPDSTSTIPLQHGLPGTVEVEVEKASPLALVLRAAGKLRSPSTAVP